MDRPRHESMSHAGEEDMSGEKIPSKMGRNGEYSGARGAGYSGRRPIKRLMI